MEGDSDPGEQHVRRVPQGVFPAVSDAPGLRQMDRRVSNCAERDKSVDLWGATAHRIGSSFRTTNDSSLRSQMNVRFNLGESYTTVAGSRIGPDLDVKDFWPHDICFNWAMQTSVRTSSAARTK